MEFVMTFVLAIMCVRAAGNIGLKEIRHVPSSLVRLGLPRPPRSDGPGCQMKFACFRVYVDFAMRKRRILFPM